MKINPGRHNFQIVFRSTCHFQTLFWSGTRGERIHFTASSRPAFHFFRVDVTGKGQGDYLVGKIVFAGTLLVLFEKSDLFMTEVILGQWVGVISLLWHFFFGVKLCHKWYWQCHTGLLYFLYVVKRCCFMVKVKFWLSAAQKKASGSFKFWRKRLTE